MQDYCVYLFPFNLFHKLGIRDFSTVSFNKHTFCIVCIFNISSNY
nr:MAG TPA: hypothetical protein [Caudoviricetes sp.]